MKIAPSLGLNKNIVNIMSEGGYYTYWISNQESVSTLGNAPESMARLSNKAIFLDNFFTGQTLARDEQILEELKKLSHKEKEFHILHLQGTHMEYAKRYSKVFEKFSIKDLKENCLDNLNGSAKLNDRQAKIKSHYLNAIYYNDLIILKMRKLLFFILAIVVMKFMILEIFLVILKQLVQDIWLKFLL
ncbi:hypothetical protein FUB65_08995 [Campylobacter coli]|nr:hypothetical protein [Campylobacter coli]